MRKTCWYNLDRVKAQTNHSVFESFVNHLKKREEK